MTWIAEQRVTWEFPSGERREGRIAIGAPVEEYNEAVCAYALDGLEHVAGPIRGTDTMQALCLALRFVGVKLHAFLTAGGRVLDDAGEDAGIEATFGPLLAGIPAKDIRP